MTESIFLFHRIHPDSDSLWNPMSPAYFESIIKYLSRNYTILKVEEYFSDKKKYHGNKEVAMIVFDDGYKDFLDYAFPILRKYNCPSSMYVVIDSVETGLPPWTYNLDYVMANSEILSIKEFEILPGYLKEREWKNKEERLQFAKKLKSYLKTLSNKERLAIYNHMMMSFNDVAPPDNLMLNWKDIEYLKKEGVGIGSHTMSHPLLNKIEKEEELNYELKKSFSLLKEKTGDAPLTISYPNGNYDERVIRIAKEVGYTIGLAVKQRQVSRTDTVFDLSRYDMYDGSKWKLKWHLYKIKKIIEKIV